MSRTTLSILLIAVFAVLHLGGCGDTATNPGLVTITGTVRNIDDGQVAEGVRVRLLDTDFSDATQTGSDGAFLIQIPRGSPLLLYTDDFDNTRADAWFPLINAEYPPAVANENLTDWPIHACPNTVMPQKGSLAAWDNYLANGDVANGDLFVPDNCASSGGIVAVLILGAAGGQELENADFSLTLDADAFPDGYIHTDNFFDENFIPDPSLGPDILYPGARTVTDWGGGFVSFGDPAFGGTQVTMTFTDADANRGLVWRSPVAVPVRPGTISLIIPCHVDGVPDVPFKQFGESMGWF